MDRCMTTMSLPLLMVAVIELLLFRCDDAYFTIRPAAFIDAPALLRVPSRGKNCGARMLCGERDTTWSNPSGKDLVEIVRGQVWAAERPFIWNSIDVGGSLHFGVAEADLAHRVGDRGGKLFTFIEKVCLE